MQVVWLLIMSVVVTGVVLGLLGGYGLSQLAAQVIGDNTGIAMTPVIGQSEWKVVAATLVLGALFALMPAVKVGRLPLQ